MTLFLIFSVLVALVVVAVAFYAIGYRQARRNLPFVPPGGPKV